MSTCCVRMSVRAHFNIPKAAKGRIEHIWMLPRNKSIVIQARAGHSCRVPTLVLRGQALSQDLLKTTMEIPFSVPPYMSLLARSVATLEGIALLGDPGYQMVTQVTLSLSSSPYDSPSCAVSSQTIGLSTYLGCQHANATRR